MTTQSQLEEHFSVVYEFSGLFTLCVLAGKYLYTA